MAEWLKRQTRIRATRLVPNNHVICSDFRAQVRILLASYFAPFFTQEKCGP